MAREFRLFNATIGFGADTRKLRQELSRGERAIIAKRRALRRLNRQLDRTRRSLSNYGRSLLSFSAIVAGLAGPGLLGRLSKDAADAGAELREASLRTGVAVEELQLLGRVFQGDGVKIEAYQRSLRKLNDALFQARLGGTEQLDAINALGLDINELTDVETTIYRIADAFKEGAVNAADAGGALRRLLGRAGDLFYIGLREGSEELKRQAEGFRDLGVLTNDLAQRLKNLAQVQTNLGDSFTVQSQILLATFADLISGILNERLERIPELFERVSAVLQYMVINVDAVKVAFGAFVALLFRGRFISRLAGSIVKVTLGLGLLTRGVFPVIRGFALLTAGVLSFGATAGAVVNPAIVGMRLLSGAVAAVRGAFLLLLGTMRLVARTALTIAIPLAVFESILSAVAFIKELGRAAEELQFTFRDAAVVATAEFVSTIALGLAKLPEVFVRSVYVAIQKTQQLFVIGIKGLGKLIRSIGSLFSEDDIRRELNEAAQELLAPPENAEQFRQRWFDYTANALGGISDATNEAVREGFEQSARAVVDRLTNVYGSLLDTQARLELDPVEIPVAEDNDSQLIRLGEEAASAAAQTRALEVGLAELQRRLDAQLPSWEQLRLETARWATELRELLSASGELTAEREAQIASIIASTNAQVEQLRAEAEQQLADTARQASEDALRNSRELTDGLRRGFADIADFATNAAIQVEEFMGNAFRGIEDALVRMVQTGKLEFSSLVDSIIADLARLVIRQQITGPIAAAFAAAFGGGVGGGGTPQAPQFFHSGGIVRGAGNVPAVLQAGEEVLTANDPRHRNNLRAGDVTVTINNQGSPIQARRDGPIRYDAGRTMVSLVTSNIQEGGEIAQAIESTFGARPATA